MRTAAVVAVVTLALSAMLWAADDAVIAPQQDATTIAPVTKDVVSSTDAINIPQILSYQGRLTDGAGVPVHDGNYSVAFKLYTAPTGGSPFWSETQSVTTRDGLFSVLLGSVTPIGSVPNAGEAYLGMAVAGDEEMTPRLRIAGAAYAYPAERPANAGLSSGGPPNFACDYWYLGTAGNDVLFTTTRYGLTIGSAGNTLNGNFDYTHVNLGAYGTTGTAGSNVGNAVIGGGWHNTAGGPFTVVPGGYYNTAGNSADDTAASVAGGYRNSATAKFASVAGGQNNTASGLYSTIPGGYGDTCAGAYGLAAGYGTRVKASANNTFAFGENCSTSTPRAVVFYHSGGATKLGVGVQNPTWNVDVSGKGRFTGKLRASAGFKADTSVADSEWATKGYVNTHGGGGGGTVTSVSQATGITCTPNPIISTGTVGFDQTYGDGRYVNESQTAGGDLTGTYPSPTIAADAVGSDEIASSAVGSSEIASGAVGSSEIAADAVGSSEIADGAVGSDELDPPLTLSASASGSAVLSVTNTNANGYGIKGTTSGGYPGVYGSGSSRGVYGTSSSWEGVYGATSNDDAVQGSYSGSYTGYAGVRGERANYGYGVYYVGGIGGSGLDVSIVRTSAGPTALYGVESPESYFEDFGGGRLSSGHARVEYDRVFLETVTISAEHPARVFVQLEDECSGVYVKPDGTGFDVHELGGGKSNSSFSYRIVAKRKGYENLRLAVEEIGYSDQLLYPDPHDAHVPAAIRAKRIELLNRRAAGTEPPNPGSESGGAGSKR